MMLTMVQGFKFFTSGFEYELILHNKITRNDLNTISNVSLVPITILSYWFSNIMNELGYKKATFLFFTTSWIIFFIWIIFQPNNTISICVYIFLLNLYSNIYFILTSVLSMSLPVEGLTGMVITMLASGANLGRFSGLHLKLIGMFGWVNCSLIGLLIQGLIIWNMNRFYDFVEEGTLEIDDHLKKIEE